MRFAYTPHASAIDETVFAWIDAVLAQGNQPCLLLDGSMFKPQVIEKWQRQSIDLKPALAGTDFDSYGLQGPLLASGDGEFSGITHPPAQGGRHSRPIVHRPATG